MDYQKQADDFMRKTGATMEVKFIGNFPFFDDDKESRNVYQITLKRNGGTYCFRFGQSIADSREYVKRNPRGKSMYDHKLIRRERIAPTTYDVLACATKSNPGTFEDFCGEYGYDTDSQKAEKIYFAVQREWRGIRSIFGDVIDELQEIN